MAEPADEPRAADERPEDELLTVDEVAELLKLNPQTVRNRIDAGEVPAIRFGRRIRIQRSALEELVGWQRGATPLPWQPPAPSEPAINNEAVAAALDDIAFDVARLAAIVRGEQPPVRRQRRR